MYKEHVHATPIQVAERFLAYTLVMGTAVLSVFAIQFSAGTLWD